MVTVSSDHGDGWIFNRVCVWLAKCAVWHPMLALFDRHLFPWLNDVIAIIFFAVQIMRRGKSELNGGGHFGSGNSYHTGHRTGIKWMSIRPYMLVFAPRRCQRHDGKSMPSRRKKRLVLPMAMSLITTWKSFGPNNTMIAFPAVWKALAFRKSGVDDHGSRLAFKK